jgi:hypothetical protein
MSRRQIAGFLVALIAASLLFVVEPAAGPARGAAEDGGAGGTGSSSVTVHGRQQGYEDFRELAVTVSKTRGLTNEAITVTWTGATPTPRRAVGTDYLQIMQCWGDPDAADFRETCQFGMGLESPALFAPGGGSTQGSVDANLRDLFHTVPDPTYPLKDPVEPLKEALMVPFRSVTGDRSKDGSPGQPFGTVRLSPTYTRPETSVDVMGKYVSAETTNEYPYAMTGGDGTGRAVFEVQNDLFAPHLGCGASMPTPSGPRPRPCSLVIVPRGHFNPYTGADVTNTNTAVHGTPFSARIWQHRIVVPLEFAPVERRCPLGKAEVDTAGSELVAEAVISWQPAVCAGDGPIIGYSSMSDFEAGNRVTSPDEGAPGLVYTPEPVPAASPVLVHAPVTLSSTVVAINIDYDIINPLHVSGPPTPEEFERLRALSVSDLKLTPRLLAKLLTQSYGRNTIGEVEEAENPDSIRFDKEFLTLNPAFRHWNRTQSATLDGLMVTATNSVAARDVWRWLLSDAEAKAWLKGAPDENGMVVNQHWRELDLATAPPETFPKADPRCVENVGPEDGVTYLLCPLEQFPPLGTNEEAARQTLRAHPKVKGEQLRPQPNEQRDWTPPPLYRYVELPRKSPGSRFAMSIVDSASAAKYGLLTAQLCKPKRDADRNLVMPDDCRTPTREAVSTAVASAAVPSAVEGAPVIDPAKAWAAAGAYPLSTITYAIGDTSEPAEARRDYAKLLRYAAGSGQEPGQADGQLPDGYVPLPASMREQTMIAAGRLENWVTSTSAPPTDDTGGSGDPGATPTPTDGVPSAGANPSASAGTPAAGVQPSADRASQSTLGSPLGIIRFILIAALVMGLLGGVAGPIMQRLATRSGRK